MFPEYEFAAASAGSGAGGESGGAGGDRGGAGGESGSAAGDGNGGDGTMAGSCNDSELNGDETDVDCGGGCARKCDAGKLCEEGLRDCKSLLCDDDGRCTDTTCDDDTQNGEETDVDCGGAGDCERCPPLGSCTEDDDCSSGSCTGERCDAGLVVYYYTQIKGDSSVIRPEIRVENVGVEAVALQHVALRYFLAITGEGESLQISENTADVSGATSRSVTASTIWQLESVEPLPEADTYLELSFASSAGSLEPNDSVTVRTSLSIQGGGTLQQGDDYSFDPGATLDSPYERVPLYFEGELLVGVEPE